MVNIQLNDNTALSYSLADQVFMACLVVGKKEDGCITILENEKYRSDEEMLKRADEIKRLYAAGETLENNLNNNG